MKECIRKHFVSLVSREVQSETLILLKYNTSSETHRGQFLEGSPGSTGEILSYFLLGDPEFHNLLECYCWGPEII